MVSDDKQIETLPHQRQWTIEAAASNGWHIARTFEGVATGKFGVRSALRDMIIDIRALDVEARPRHILAIRFDRIGRQGIETQLYVRDLKNLGVSFFTRDQGEIHVDTAMEQLIVGVQAFVAQHENEIKSDKTRAVYRRKRAAGEILANRRAYGLRPDTRTKDAPDGDLADIVRTAFAMRLSGEGYQRIARTLHPIAPPRMLKNGKQQYVVWSDNRVKRMLSNRAYVVGGVVDEVTFARVQRINADTLPMIRSQVRHPWPLTGAIACHCGRRFLGRMSGRDYAFRYYCCRSVVNHDGKSRQVRAEPVEAQFVALLRRLSASPELIARYRRQAVAAKPHEIEAALRKLRARLAAIAKSRTATWSLHEAGRVRPEDIQERLDALNEEKVDIEKQVASLEEQLAISTAANRRDRNVENTIARAATEYERSDIEGKRAIARAVAIEVGGLCVEQDGTLTIRRPVPGRQQIAGRQK